MADIKKVGAQIIVEGADVAAQNFEQAAKAQADFTAGTEKLSQALNENQKPLDAFQQRLHALPEEFQDAAIKMNQAGVRAGTALTAVEEAMKSGVSAATLNAQADEMLAEKMTVAAQAAEAQRIALNDDTDATKVNAEAKKELQDQAIKLGLGFFALSIAARGLRDIGRELGHIYGEDVSRAFEKVADTVQTIGSFGSGGALIGSIFGPAGTIAGAGIGGAIGILSSLPALLDQTDKGTQALYDDIQKLAQSSQASQSLSELTGITKEDADAALLAAKNNDLLRDAILGVANAKRNQENKPQVPEAVREQDPSQIQDEYTAYALAADNAARANLALAVSYAQVVIQQQAEIDAANKTYDANQKIIDKLVTENGFLETSTGLTKDQVVALQSYINAHQDAGDALANTLTKLNDLIRLEQEDSEHHQLFTKGIQDLTGTVHDEAQALLDAAEAEKRYQEQLKAATEAQKQFESAVQSSNTRLAQLDAKYANDRANAIQSYNDTVDNAVRTENDAIFNAEQSLTDKIASLWQKLQDSVVDINSKLADKIDDINTQLANRISDIQTQLGNKLADIQTQLADKLSNIEQGLTNKLQELAHTRDQSLESDNLKIEQAARDLAEKLFEIERTRIEATNALDFNTGEQLRNARTEHDREDILRKHQFDQAQIDQKANDDRHDAEESFADKVAAANKEKELAKSTYDYQVRLAKELADQQIAQAERDAAQQSAVARRDAAQQLAVAQRTAEQQLALAQREHDQALLLAERQYEQEKEAAVKSYNEQVAAAARAEAEKLADAQHALAERNKAIAESYALERAQILQTLELALWAYNKIIDSINLAQTHLLGFSQAYQNFLSDPLGQNGGSSGLLPRGTFPNVGGYGGLDMDVPSGHDRDTFMIGARTGEHVTITPPGVNNSSSSRTNYFNIYDATNPQKVAQVVSEFLSNEAWR